MTRPEVGWYLRRLRQMSPGEVVSRSRDAARRASWARRQVPPGGPLAPHPRALADRSFATPVPDGTRAAVSQELAAELVAAADAVLAGGWPVLGVTRPDSRDPDWFLDPVTGRRAPDRTLAFRVQHRDETETGNVKQVWELSRHHHLTVLAGAWWLTGDETYAETAADQLRSWWRANPFLTGVHWTSGIEAGVRLVSWAWVRRLLDDWPKVGDLFEHDDDAVRQLGWHQEFLAAFPSRGSSANNHVVAEAAGRLVAACAFPWFEQSRRWRTAAAALLERELAANTFDDGLNRELATDYHRFVLELAQVAAVEADAAGHPLSPSTWERLARMTDAAAAVLDVAGRPPRQGDGDEGRALLLDDPERDPWSVVLGTGRALLGAPTWWPAVHSSVQAQLVGALGRPHRASRPSAAPRVFPDAGLVLLRSAPTDGPEIWCRCDGGPHGFLSIAAHAHADALSLELRHDGVEILVDPGTYCYHGEPVWRSWFRSTAAHNTLEVAGVDQSEPGGPFLWQTQARTTTLACDVGEQPVQTWSAEHDGYRRLATPTTHRRSVVLDSPAHRLVVTDTLDGGDPVPVTLSWHLGPDVQVALQDGTARLSWSLGPARRTAELTLPAQLDWSVRRGETDPAQGWCSPRFGTRLPAPALVGRGVLTPGAELLTRLDLP